MNGRLPLARWGDLPGLLCRRKISSLCASLFLPVFSPSFFLIHSVVTNSSIYCLVKLRDSLNLRAGISNVLRLLLSTRSQLTISMIWSILALWLCITLAQCLLFTSCTLSREKRRNVSTLFSLLLALLFFFFFFHKRFLFVGMPTKFNQDKYAKMWLKKNEPLSNLRKRTVHVVEKRSSLPQLPPTLRQ